MNQAFMIKVILERSILQKENNKWVNRESFKSSNLQTKRHNNDIEIGSFSSYTSNFDKDKVNIEEIKQKPQLEMRQTYFNSNWDEDSDEYESISNKNYHVINELSEGKYFGEISLLNGTHTTASIHCVSDVICAKINKASFFQFLGDFKGCEVLIRTKLYEYNDIFFTKMHRIIKNAKWFSSLESQSVRRILYMLQRRIFQTGNHIVLSRQLADNFYFVISGTVGIYIEDFEAKTKTLFWKLKEGSSFNVWNCLLSHYSLFRYEAFTDWIIAVCLKIKQS